MRKLQRLGFCGALLLVAAGTPGICAPVEFRFEPALSTLAASTAPAASATWLCEVGSEGCSQDQDTTTGIDPFESGNGALDPVAEPGCLLLIVGGLGFFWFRRRDQKTHPPSERPLDYRLV